MDFRSENKFNDRVNTLSGNFFPMSGEREPMSIGLKIYMVFAWISRLTFMISTLIGLVSYVPVLEAVRDGGVTTCVIVEDLVISTYMYSRTGAIRKIVGKLNEVMIDSAELKQVIYDTVVPHKDRMKGYTIAVIASVVMWAGLPGLAAIEGTNFTYTDFVLPSYYPGEPYTVTTFSILIVIDTVGGIYLVFNKNAIDTYVSYLVTLLTAEFRYLNKRICAALSENDTSDPDAVLNALRKCIQHHSNLNEIGDMLTDLLGLNVGMTYINCILKFCLLAFSLILMPGQYVSKFIYVLFMMGNLVQVYFLCACAQELLDESGGVTEDAFHENWYDHHNGIQQIFYTMSMSSRIEVTITAFHIVDLTVPSFSAIMNNAYTGCLLLLNMVTG